MVLAQHCDLAEVVVVAELAHGRNHISSPIATHAKKDVRLGASADESKDSAH